MDALAVSLVSATTRGGQTAAFRIARLKDTMVGPVRGWMLLALIAVALVLLTACVNVANLQLTRALLLARGSCPFARPWARHDAMSCCRCSSERVSMLSLTAAGIAIVIAIWGIAVVKGSLPAGIARVDEIGLDRRVLPAAVGRQFGRRAQRRDGGRALSHNCGAFQECPA